MTVDYGSVTETFTLHLPTGGSENDDLIMPDRCTKMYERWKQDFQSLTNTLITSNNTSSILQIQQFLESETDLQGIKTAVVVGGYNGSDHQEFYEKFDSPTTIIIKTANNTKDFLSQIITKLYGKDSNNCDFDVSRINKSCQVCIVIPQFEQIDLQILERVVKILESGRSNLTFVFGVTTSQTLIQLSKQTSSLLNTKIFKLVESKIIIDEIVLFLLKSDLKLGWSCFRQILTRFLNYDYSILNFLGGVRYSMMAKTSDPICKFLAHDLRFEDICGLDLERVRLLGSFRNYVEELGNGDQEDRNRGLELVTNDLALFNWSKQQMQILATQNKVYEQGFLIVLKLQSLFTKTLRKPMYYIYDIMLKGNLGESDYIQTCILLLRFIH